MAQKPSRVYHNFRAFQIDTENATKSAMQSTVNYFKKMLLEFAREDIYNNAYKKKWYDRTDWLKDDNAVEGYIYKNSATRWGGGVRFNKSAYDSVDRSDFQHGNPLKYLEMGSYLEIMNNSSLLNPNNPYHFPVVRREPFYDDFLKEIKSREYGFHAVFRAFFDAAMNMQNTGKPTIPKIPKRNKAVSGAIGATSSSTSQYKSLHTSNIS